MSAIDQEKLQSAKSIEVLTDMMAGCALSIATISNRSHDDLEGVIAFSQAILKIEEEECIEKKQTTATTYSNTR